jgi:hypothetical protein
MSRCGRDFVSFKDEKTDFILSLWEINTFQLRSDEYSQEQEVDPVEPTVLTGLILQSILSDWGVFELRAVFQEP